MCKIKWKLCFSLNTQYYFMKFFFLSLTQWTHPLTFTVLLFWMLLLLVLKRKILVEYFYYFTARQHRIENMRRKKNWSVFLQYIKTACWYYHHQYRIVTFITFKFIVLVIFTQDTPKNGVDTYISVCMWYQVQSPLLSILI